MTDALSEKLLPQHPNIVSCVTFSGPPGTPKTVMDPEKKRESPRGWTRAGSDALGFFAAGHIMWSVKQGVMQNLVSQFLCGIFLRSTHRKMRKNSNINGREAPTVNVHDA